MSKNNWGPNSISSEDSEANYIDFIHKLDSKDNGDDESHSEGSGDDDDDWNIFVVYIRGRVVVWDVGVGSSSRSPINLTDHRHHLTGPHTMAVNVSPTKSWEGSQTVPVVDRRVAVIPGGKVRPGAVNPLIKNVQFYQKVKMCQLKSGREV